MLKNYLKLAFKVLGRNKLYTAISLFGISFTLAVLMLSAAFLDNEMGKNPPLTKMDRITYVPMLRMKKWNVEKIVSYDTTHVDGKMVIDTLRTEKKIVGDSNNSSGSGVGYDFIRDNLKGMKHAELVSVFSPGATMELFQNSKKLTFRLNNCDATYFKIFDFEFIEGRPFTDQEIENQAQVIVLSQKAAKEYFGKQASYLGQMVDYSGKQIEVIGVVKDVNTSIGAVSTEAFMPFTHVSPSLLNYGWGFFGDMEAAILSPTVADVAGLEQEMRTLEKTIDMTPVIDDFDALFIYDSSILENYAKPLIQNWEKKNNYSILKLILSIGLFLFVLIPTLNLINLNTTRIMERAAEIGVRKSFGAKTGDLMIQFLFENLILTLLGGLLGFLLSIVAMYFLNGSGLLGISKFALNPKIFFICLGITVLFGIVSGLLPAYRTSKTSIASAIKTNAI